MNLGPRYRLVGALDWRDIDGDWVVFCSASAALQCVDIVGAALLAWLEDGPATADELTRRLAAAAPQSVPADAEIGVAERLLRWELDGWLEAQEPACA